MLTSLIWEEVLQIQEKAFQCITCKEGKQKIHSWKKSTTKKIFKKLGNMNLY